MCKTKYSTELQARYHLTPEEAAGDYAEKHRFRVPYDGSDNFYDDVDVKASKEGFLAGAKWQEEKDQETIKLAEDHAFLAGADWQKDQMLTEDKFEKSIGVADKWQEGYEAGVYDTERKLKPKDWSEEDEKTINELCNIIVSNSKNGHLGRYHAGDLVQKLKSLHPQSHWKPSEEEMKALDVACSGKLWYGEIYLEGLKRIREQLKKL